MIKRLAAGVLQGDAVPGGGIRQGTSGLPSSAGGQGHRTVRIDAACQGEQVFVAGPEAISLPVQEVDMAGVERAVRSGVMLRELGREEIG